VETAGNRNLQTITYKQEIQLIQVAKIGQAGRGASIDAGMSNKKETTKHLHIKHKTRQLIQ
jgi:hypothetical protein